MAPSENEITDDSISQFLAFSGAVDPAVARQYLEMSGNNLETAVSLFMDHSAGGGGAATAGGMRGATGTGGGGSAGTEGIGGGVGGGGGFYGGGLGQPHEVRAPDVSRSMRLVGGDSPVGRGGGMGGGGDPSAGLMAAMGGPAAREMMRNMMAAENGGGLEGHEALLGSMGSTWAAADDAGAAGASGGGREAGHRRGNGEPSARTGGAGGRNPRRNSQRNNSDDDGDVQVVGADGQAMDEDDEYNYFSDEEEGSDDGHDLSGRISNSNASSRNNAVAISQPPSLSTMFAQPTHLMHRGGGFIGAKNFAKDARRWLLVNIQSDDDFACHALNRDVWRDELVENLVREGFILWQAMSSSNEGQTYITRYKVTGYPHLAIIDPRTGSLLWRKESWTQVNPLTAEQFVEIASDFCSRHSFDKLPMAARHAYANSGMPLGGAPMASSSNENSSAANSNNKRPIHELTEEEQLQAAIRASMQENGDGGDDEDLKQEVGGEKRGAATGAADNNNNTKSSDMADGGEPKPSAFEQEILSMEVGEEPTLDSTVARVQIRMPDGKRLVRKFCGGSQVKIIYAFVAQQPVINEKAIAGKSFELKFGFPPKDLFSSIGDSISSCGLNGEVLVVIWK